MVELDVDGFFGHAFYAGQICLFEGLNELLRGTGEDVEGPDCVQCLVGNHEDAELKGCHGD